MKKRIISIIMSLVIVVSLCACGNTETQSGETTESVQNENPALEFERKCYETVDYAFANFQAYLDKFYTGTTYDVVEVLVYNSAVLKNRYPYVYVHIIDYDSVDELNIDQKEGDNSYFEYYPEFNSDPIVYKHGWKGLETDADKAYNETKNECLSTAYGKTMIAPGLYVEGKSDISSIELTDTYAFLLDWDDYNSYRNNK